MTMYEFQPLWMELKQACALSLMQRSLLRMW